MGWQLNKAKKRSEGSGGKAVVAATRAGRPALTGPAHHPDASSRTIFWPHGFPGWEEPALRACGAADSPQRLPAAAAAA